MMKRLVCVKLCISNPKMMFVSERERERERERITLVSFVSFQFLHFLAKLYLFLSGSLTIGVILLDLYCEATIINTKLNLPFSLEAMTNQPKQSLTFSSFFLCFKISNSLQQNTCPGVVHF